MNKRLNVDSGELPSSAPAEQDWLASRFEMDRRHLRRVAYGILGSLSDAEDAVQEAWLRASRANPKGVENLTAWLTTIVGRVSLDMLRSRDARREGALDSTFALAAGDASPELGNRDPECEAVVAESVGLALLVVLATLGPAERLAFVLHDMFSVRYQEIATILGRSPEAARQLASRARRRVRGGRSRDCGMDLASQRKIVETFVAALRAGDMNAVLSVLDQNLIVRSDRVDALGNSIGRREAYGAAKWAKQAIAFSRVVTGAQIALVDGAVGVILAPCGRLERALKLSIQGRKIMAIDAVIAPARVAQLQVGVLGEYGEQSTATRMK